MKEPNDLTEDGALMARTVVTRTLRITRVRTLSEDPGNATVPCSACGHDVPAVTPIEALRLLQAAEEAFALLLESGAVHTVPTTAGATWICRDSLFRRLP